MSVLCIRGELIYEDMMTFRLWSVMSPNEFAKLLLEIDFLHKPVILSGGIKPADILRELQRVRSICKLI